ncbi:MAG TPA: hypothetical protein PK413_00520 [Thermoanaerobaculia bacterium]|nr:hypothetical protein [Thermoanaerobaculia bacterium]
MTSHLEDIVKLEAALTELASRESQLNEIPDWMRELHTEHAARLAEIKALEDAAEAAREERRTAEAAIAEAQERLKKYQQQIHQVTNQREYGALLQEIDSAKTKISEAETVAVGALERREMAETRLAEERAAFAALDTRYAVELSRWEGEKPGISERIGELRELIGTLRDRLPKGSVSLFDRVRQRYNGTGIAQILEVERGGRGPKVWHCGACNYSVRPQVVVQVRTTGALLQCDGCKRILYVTVESA